MSEKVTDFFRDSKNYNLIRHVGFSMATVGLLVGAVALIVAIAVDSLVLALCAAGMALVSVILFPVTDLNFPKSGWY